MQNSHPHKLLPLLILFGTVLIALSGCGGGGPLVVPKPIIGINPPGLTFTLNDQCADGRGIQARFFEYRGASITGRWPSTTDNVYTADSGDRLSQRLLCTPGQKVCYGATEHPNDGTGYWGVGLDGRSRSSRTNNCTTCPSGSGTYGVNLLCSSATTTPPPPPPPSFDGVGSNQVGNEFGRTSTTGRTGNLTCNDDVFFSNQGTVVLPSVDVVTLPSAAGTVTLEYDAFSIPDRFVVEVGGRVVIDTQYVGSSNSVAEVNAVLNHYGFRPTSQARIIPPGRGSRSFQKSAGITSAVVRIYAPLKGTEWEVTLKFAGGSCTGTGGPSSRLYGAVFSSLANDCQSHRGGIASNYNTQLAARSAARNECISAGGTSCSRIIDFGSAYRGANQCGALAYGRSPTQCRLRGGTGSSESAAEAEALSNCQSGGFTCSLVLGRGGARFAQCTN